MADWKEVKGSPTGRNTADFMTDTTRLSEYILGKNICIHHIYEKCSNRKRCRYTHINNAKLFYEINNIFKNPYNIKNSNITEKQLIENIKLQKNIFNTNKKPFVSSCIYAITNQQCQNFNDGRYVISPIKINNKIIPVHICYPDISKCKTRIICGLHFDMEFSFKNNVFDISKFISFDDEIKFNESTKNIKPKQNKKEVVPISKNNADTKICITINNNNNTEFININDKNKKELKNLLLKLSKINNENYNECNKLKEHNNHLLYEKRFFMPKQEYEFTEHDDVDNYMYGPSSENDYYSDDDYDDYPEYNNNNRDYADDYNSLYN